MPRSPFSDSDFGQLVTYALGEYAPDEADALRAWVETDDARIAMVKKIQRVHASGAALIVSRDGQASLGAFRAQVHPRTSSSPSDVFRRASRPSLRRSEHQPWWRWAVVAGGAAVLAIGAWTLWPSRERVHQTTVMREYATASGQQATVRLDDATVVTLNVGSRLRVPTDFGTNTRIVYLDGEAAFHARPDARRPFVVEAGGFVARDLGTVFGVRAYPGEGRTQVVVADGRVAVHTDAASAPNAVTLSRGDLAVRVANGAMEVRRGVNVDDYLGWTQQELFFDQARVRDVLTQLSRWYALEFLVSDPTLADRVVTARIRGRTLTQENLDLLADVLDARVVRRGDTIAFHPR